MSIISSEDSLATKIWNSIIKKLDKNSDGSLSKDEFLSSLNKSDDRFAKVLDRAFTKLDKDSDDKVSKEEFLSMLPPPPPPPMEFMDMSNLDINSIDDSTTNKVSLV